MIRLAKLVTGRLQGEVREGTSGRAVRGETTSCDYGVSRLGLVRVGSDTVEEPPPPRPSFAESLRRCLQTPALPEREPEADRAAASSGSGPTAVAEAAAGPAPPPVRARKPYKKTSVKLPRHMAARLKAYAHATDSYQYAVVTEALGRFLDEAVACLPPQTRDAMGDLEEQFEQEEPRSKWRQIFSFRWR